ncbi:unnamed protein product [Phaeothamnion confervicola]
MLHATRHPAAAVCGFLLGDSKGVTDAIPLFHHTPLTPLLETAAVMVEAYAKRRGEGLEIVGFYSANPHLDVATLAPFVHKVAEQINDRRPGAVALLVHNKRLESPDEHALLAFAQDSSRTFKRTLAVEVVPDATKKFNAALRRGAAASVVDFDDHVDDVLLDWTNPAVTAGL